MRAVVHTLVAALVTAVTYVLCSDLTRQFHHMHAQCCSVGHRARLRTHTSACCTLRRSTRCTGAGMLNSQTFAYYLVVTLIRESMLCSKARAQVSLWLGESLPCCPAPAPLAVAGLLMRAFIKRCSMMHAHAMLWLHWANCRVAPACAGMSRTRRSSSSLCWTTARPTARRSARYVAPVWRVALPASVCASIHGLHAARGRTAAS